LNVMIDTNVILDDILNRAPNAKAAQEINQLVLNGEINGYITANCLTDIFYIVSKSLNEIVAKKIIKNLLLTFSVMSVDSQDCWKAIDLFLRDFEDALVVVCAEKAALNYIITNDKNFLMFINSSVPLINPVDFLLKLQS